MAPPAAADPAAPFWAAAAKGELLLPRCDDCAAAHLYPRGRCPVCGGARLIWTAGSGRGEVYSFSVLHRAPTPAFAADVPYTVAVVRLAEGPHLMGRLAVPPDAARIGLPVRLRWSASPAEDGGRPLALFEPL